MTPNPEILHQKLALLIQEHRELDKLIETLREQTDYDQFAVTRLKKRKLLLKDMITRVRSQLIPDLNA